MIVRMEPGSVVVGYMIEGLVGTGGMGEVYVARQLRLDRKVALKVLPARIAKDAGFRERFVRESQLAAAIEHPNVIPIYDADEVEGILYIAMRYIKGGLDLRQALMRQKQLDLPSTMSIVGQIASALDAAHSAGLVHRDVKPENILIDESERPAHCYLVDFGVTKRISTGDRPLTGRGEFAGTIDYMAPEQIENRNIDQRTDVYGPGLWLLRVPRWGTSLQARPRRGRHIRPSRGSPTTPQSRKT
jgi:serine/threonine protein kinase